MMRLFVAGSLALLALAGVASERGRALYHDGAGLRARGMAGVALDGRAGACANCHNDPSDGGGEGGVTAPALAWSRLGTPSEVRPAYDAASFAQALRLGRTPGGRDLHPLMPRYTLDDVEVDALIAYLRQPPRVSGLDDTTVRLATILPPEGPLRAAGMRAATTLGEAIAAANARGPIFGRTMQLAVIDASTGPHAVAATLDADPPLLVIGSVGLAGDGALADVLAKRRLLNFAPLAGLGVVDDERRLLSLRPSLADQALALARQAIETHGCVAIAAADDPLSQQARQRTEALIEARAECPGLLVLAPQRLVSATLADHRDAHRTHLYVVADQAGKLPELPLPAVKVVQAYAGRTLTNEAAHNAEQAVKVLADALAIAGRAPSARVIVVALGQTARANVAPILITAP